MFHAYWFDFCYISFLRLTSNFCDNSCSKAQFKAVDDVKDHEDEDKQRSRCAKTGINLASSFSKIEANWCAEHVEIDEVTPEFTLRFFLSHFLSNAF